MPAALPKARLRDMAPTAEEVDAARKIIAGSSKEEVKSKMTCFSEWIKKQEQSEDIAASRGDARKEWLCLFLAHQARSKSATKKTTVEKHCEVYEKDDGRLLVESRIHGPGDGSDERKELERVRRPEERTLPSHGFDFAAPRGVRRSTTLEEDVE